MAVQQQQQEEGWGGLHLHVGLPVSAINMSAQRTHLNETTLMLLRVTFLLFGSRKLSHSQLNLETKATTTPSYTAASKSRSLTLT